MEYTDMMIATEGAIGNLFESAKEKLNEAKSWAKENPKKAIALISGAITGVIAGAMAIKKLDKINQKKIDECIRDLRNQQHELSSITYQRIKSGEADMSEAAAVDTQIDQLQSQISKLLKFQH